MSVENSQERENGLPAIRMRLEATPYDYDAHLQFIAINRQLQDFATLNQAREYMSSLFPLSLDLWVDWIEDAILLASKPEELKNIVELHHRALMDYQNIAIHVSLLEFLAEQYLNAQDDDLDWPNAIDVLAECRKSIDATESHYAESHLVWNVYKDFKVSLLSENMETDIEAFRKEFIMRLKVPHAALDATFTDYSSFETKFDNANYIDRLKFASMIVSKTRAECKERDKLETALAQTGNELPAFWSYIDYEKKGKDLSKTILIFERAATIHCLESSFWDEYLTFAFLNAPSTQLELLAHRATRNCMYSVELWCHYLNIKGQYAPVGLDGFGSLIKDVYQRAIAFVASTGNIEFVTQILLCRIFIESRQVNTEGTAEEQQTKFQSLFKSGLDMLKSVPGPNTAHTFERNVAFIQCNTFKNIKEAQNIFEALLKKNNQAHIWAEYAALMRTANEIDKARAIFKNAIFKKLDDFELLFSEWRTFEVRFGTTKQLYECFIERLRLQRKNPELFANQMLSEQKRSAPDDGGEHKAKKSKQEVEAPVVPAHSKVDIANFKVIKKYIHCDISSSAGSMIYLENLDSHLTPEMLKRLFLTFGRIIDMNMQPNPETGILEAYIEFLDSNVVRILSASPVILEGKELGITRCRPEGNTWDFKQEEQKHVIYVSNLPTTIDKIVLRNAFKGFGTIQEIRLTIRGQIAFAYIDFESQESAANSLKMDQTQLFKTTINVAISDPRKKKVAKIDPKHLIVNNLAFNFTEPEVIDLFKPCGDLKESRLLLDERGRSKGTAFLMFETEESAKKALEINGTMHSGRMIVVSVADPNRKAQRREFENSLRAGKSERNAGPNFQVIPVAKSKHKKLLSMPAKKNEKNDAMDVDAVSRVEAQAKTQDDFRRMMLGGK